MDYLPVVVLRCMFYIAIITVMHELIASTAGSYPIFAN